MKYAPSSSHAAKLHVVVLTNYSSIISYNAYVWAQGLSQVGCWDEHFGRTIFAPSKHSCFHVGWIWIKCTTLSECLEVGPFYILNK